MGEESRIAQLIVKLLRHELADADKLELDAWLDRSPANREFLENAVREDEIVADLKILVEMDREAIQRKFDYLVQQGEPAVARPQIKRRIIRFAAAAVILGLIAGVVYFLITGNRQLAGHPGLSDTAAKKNAGQVAGTTSKRPAVNRATIIIADKFSVQLDTIPEGGRIKGNPYIVKIDSNRVTFKTDTGTTRGYHELGGALAGNNTAVYHQLLVPPGARYRAQLPDGTEVFMNAGSSLRFPAAFTGINRLVELDGEAYFDVRKDPGHAFVVRTKRQQVEVIGTKFDIRDYPDEPMQRTILENGAISIRGKKGNIILAPGQEVQIDSQGSQPKRYSGLNLDKVLSWRKGEYFNFDNLDIRAAIWKLAQWYGMKVSFAKDVKIGTLGVGDIQQDLPLEVLLKDLELPDLHFEIRGDVIVVTR